MIATKRAHPFAAWSAFFCVWFALSTSAGKKPAVSKDSFLAGHRKVAAGNPEGVSLRIRLVDGKGKHRPGESIRLELAFSSSIPDTYVLHGPTYDRSGRLEIDKYKVDPEENASDPIREYFAAHPIRLGGGLHNNILLNDSPHRIEFEINEWLRFDKPGKYRLYVVSNRIMTKSPGRDRKGFGLQSVGSNVIEFWILASDPEWEAEELIDIVEQLDSEDPMRASPPSRSQHMKARRRLRFLGTKAAAREMIRRIGSGDVNGHMSFGLVGSPHRKLIVEEMEKGLSYPDIPVSDTYLGMLALLAYNLEHSEPPVLALDAAEEERKKHFEESEKRSEGRRKLMNKYTLQMADAIDEKRGQALAVSLETLLGTASSASGREVSTLPPDLAERLPAMIAAVFTELPYRSQEHLLSYRWESIRCPEIKPVLKKLYESGRSKRGDLRPMALRRLYEMSPAEGRRLILEELRSPDARMGIHVLGILPDETLPELDDVLADNLQGTGNLGSTSEIVSYIERYASTAALPKVRTFYGDKGGRWACAIQNPLLAYFLRVEMSLGIRLIRAAMAARGRGYSRCYTTLLSEVTELHFCPELEKIAIHHLADPDAAVVGDAAKMLGTYGSMAAEKYLWVRLELWHEAWKGRAGELQQYDFYHERSDFELMGKMQVEWELANALATGASWFADKRKLEKIKGLCVTDQAINEIERMIDGWSRKIYIRLYPLGEVAQYRFDSVDGLKTKLAQFPGGTLFHWVPSAPAGRKTDEERVFSMIKTFLKERGMKLERSPF